MGQTLLDRVWESHLVRRADGLPDLLYVDLHLVHEVTSPQAFESLRLAGRPVRRPDLTLATMDHNVATGDDTPADPLSQQQLDALQRNCDEFGVPLYATGSGREGIVHVIGPELGLTQPGMTIVARARAGVIAPDDVTVAYVEGRPGAPKGADWDAAVARWRTLVSDDDAVFDRELEIDVSELRPQVTWGTNPGMVVPIDGVVPDPEDIADA